jgi:hypothetical protein
LKDGLADGDGADDGARIERVMKYLPTGHRLIDQMINQMIAPTPIKQTAITETMAQISLAI